MFDIYEALENLMSAIREYEPELQNFKAEDRENMIKQLHEIIVKLEGKK